MAHSQPFTTLVYQHHSSSDLTGSPAGDGRQYTTYQWRGPRMLSLDTSPTSRQGPQDFFSSGSTGLAPSAFPSTFPTDSQGFVFQLSNNGMPPGESRQIDNAANARRPFIRRRSARLHERQIRDESHSLALASDTARYDLRSTRPRAGDQFIPGQHATVDPLREYDNYPSSQFSSPASPASPPELQWHNFQTAVSPAESVQRAASPTSSTASAMDPGNGNAHQAPLAPRPRKRRVSNRDKRDICEFHDEHPEMRQQDIAERWLIERSTVSKILKQKDRWLSIDPGERRTIYRLKDTKFPQVESGLQKWLKECNDNGISVTDSEIKEKAKSIVPTLVVTGAFKASAGWLDNFKQRNGISHGRRTWEGTAYLDRRATGADYMVRNTEPEMDTSGTLPTDIPQPYPTQEGTPSSQSVPTIEEMVNTMVATDADIAMHEEHGTYVDAGVIAVTSGTTPPPLLGSDLSSPAAEDAVMQEAVIAQSTAMGVGGVENGVGDAVATTTEDQPFTHTQNEAYDVSLDRSPTPPPAPRSRAGLIDGSMDVEDHIDAAIVWFDQNPGFLQSLERDWIGRFKHIMLCYNTTGSIDRQRYAHLG